MASSEKLWRDNNNKMMKLKMWMNTIIFNVKLVILRNSDNISASQSTALSREENRNETVTEKIRENKTYEMM